MSLERFPDAALEVPNRYLEVSNANATLTPRDQVVRAVASSAAFTITLPKVSECKGMIFSIFARDADGTNTVTVAHGGDSEGWTNVVLNNTGEGCIVYSDGTMWWVLATPNVS